MEAYVKLGMVALLPALVAMILYLLEKKTIFSKVNKNIRMIIYGIIFGGIAVIGNEWGIPIKDAQVNCRDAAVLTAGLMFGAPAGIIAGVIGGVERWIAVAWGVGSFTRLACSLSTIIAGIYAGALRKYMFEDKKPGCIISLAIGVVMEVFHMTMVFITNMSYPEKAMEVVKACTLPMVIANGISLMLASIMLSILSTGAVRKRKNPTHISQTIQQWLLVAVILAFLATSGFVYGLQAQIAVTQANSLLNLAVEDLSSDISDMSDRNLLELTYRVAEECKDTSILDIADKYSIAEINLINKSGVIYKSTNPEFIGFEMGSGAQSAEFLCLLGDTQEYVQAYRPIAYDSGIKRKYAAVKSEDGFIQVGYDAENFQHDIDLDVINITKNRHVGKTGFILIIDKNFNVVSAPSSFKQKSFGNQTASASLQPDKTFRTLVNNEKCFCRYKSVEGYYIISVLPEAEAMQTQNTALYVNTFMEVLVFAILFAMIYFLIKKVVVNRIKSINKALGKITNGDLGVVVNERSSEEFASLSDDINSTVNTLKCYIEEAAARIDKELEFAKNIQTSALPSSFPAFPKRKDLDIFASMNPAKEVGGDFYDFYLTDVDKLHFLIADVSGKGIPAAMFMMRAKAELKSLTESEMPVEDVFTNGNHALCEGNDAGMFVTAWQGGIDLSTGLVKFANAGHNPPLVRHSDGKFEYVRTRAGFVLAGMDGVKYKPQELQLYPGDIIYLYTDGVTEATNENNELYGEDRLLAAINAREFEGMKELCDYVKADVDAFVGNAPQFDDITMLALKFVGKKTAASIRFDEAKIEDITAVTEFVEAELEKLNCSMKMIMQINIAIDELYSNIVRYGYPNASGPITVAVAEKDEPHMVYVRFCDEGVPYNPLIKDDPDVTLSAEERKIGGLGIYMVKKSMDDIKYKYENDQNILTIYKKFD